MILKLAGEVRQQLGLQLAISRTLVDLHVMREFQEVIEIIRAEALEAARRGRGPPEGAPGVATLDGLDPRAGSVGASQWPSGMTRSSS